MILEKKRFKLSVILLALIVAFSMMVPTATALAKGEENILNGTARVDQFGGYDVNVEVSVENDKISEINIEGTNFAGLHGEENKGYLTRATNGIKDKFKGLSVKDASKIYNVDGVSGSTLSCNAIRKAVLNALNLELPKDNRQLTPKKMPSPGKYTIEMKNETERVLGSDKESPVKHGMVEADIVKADLVVGKDGNMRLSYDVNPKEKGSMYVIDYLGYFKNDGSNDSKKLKSSDLQKDGQAETRNVTESDIDGISDKVVTRITRLMDKEEIQHSAHFDCFKVYVPVMSMNPKFSKGFDVITNTTLDWSTLKSVSGSKPNKKINLKNGKYTVKANMTTPSGGNSMAGGALNKTLNLRVSNGKYYITPEFNKIKKGNISGYLGKIAYFDSNYQVIGSIIKGKTKDVKVLEYHKDKKGRIIKDKYGKNYPKKVEFQLIPEALVDGKVPVQITIPVMNSLMPGSGTKQAMIKIDWKSVKKVNVKKPKKVLPKKMKLKVKAQKKRKVKLTWAKNKKASGFVIYMATSKNGKFKAVNTLKGSKNVKWVKTKLKAKKKYYFMIKAFKYQKGKKVFIAISPRMMVKVIK